MRRSATADAIHDRVSRIQPMREDLGTRESGSITSGRVIGTSLIFGLLGEVLVHGICDRANPM
jgi:hypothetical protein